MTPTITVSADFKRRLEDECTQRRTDLQVKRKRVSDEIKLRQADLTLIDQQLATNFNESLALRALKIGEYTVLNIFGDNKPMITSLFSKPQDYVYVTASRSNGPSHTTRWDEQTWDWRCDCKSGQERGWCWVTKAVQKGVKLDARKNPFITDEKGEQHNVARFGRQV